MFLASLRAKPLVFRDGIILSVIKEYCCVISLGFVTFLKEIIGCPVDNFRSQTSLNKIDEFYKYSTTGHFEKVDI